MVSMITCLAGLATACCCAKSKLMRSKTVLEAVSPDVSCPEKFTEVSQRNLHRLVANPARAATTYFRVLRRMPMWGDEYGIYEALAQRQIPVLFIWGEDDGTIPLDEVGADLSRLFAPSGAACLVIPRTGHHSFLEFPGQVAQHAINWFSDSQDPAWQYRLDQGRACLGALGSAGRPGVGDSNQCGHCLKEISQHVPHEKKGDDDSGKGLVEKSQHCSMSETVLDYILKANQDLTKDLNDLRDAFKSDSSVVPGSDDENGKGMSKDSKAT